MTKKHDSNFDTTMVGSPPISNIVISNDKKVEVLTEYWMSLRERWAILENRAYSVTVWSVGLVFSGTGYLLVQSLDLTSDRRVTILIAFAIFGSLTQVFLHVINQSYLGTGKAIERTQAALRFYETGQYLSEERFFGYSGTYLPKVIISSLRVLHIVALLFAAVVVMFVI
jgi:hypothetical protein